MAKAETINYAEFPKPVPTWTRDQRVEWALATLGESAPYFWVVYRLDAANFPMKIGELQGLEFDDNASAAQFGAGKFRRELRVRGNRTIGTIINEDFGIAPSMTTRHVASGDVYTPSPPDRLAALEAKIEALARGLGAVGGTQGVSVGGLTLRDAIDLAKSFAPPVAPAPAQNVMGMVETLFAVEKLSRRLYGARRDDDDQPRDAADGMGGLMKSILETFTRATPPPTPPTPSAPPAPSPKVESPREPFPGAATIADAIPGLVNMLPPVADREGISAETLAALSDAVADAIEEGLGSPVKIAERFRTGGAIVESLIRYRPSLAEHRGLLQIAADVFVADQLAPDAHEVGDE